MRPGEPNARPGASGAALLWGLLCAWADGWWHRTARCLSIQCGLRVCSQKPSGGVWTSSMCIAAHAVARTTPVVTSNTHP